MAKHRVTFEVDNSQLFDRLHEMSGDTGPLGTRLVETLLMPADAGLITQIGMGVYGVTLVGVEAVPPAPI